MKKNFAIIILSILVIGLGAYIVTNKFFLKSEENCSKEVNCISKVEKTNDTTLEKTDIKLPDLKEMGSYETISGVYKFSYSNPKDTNAFCSAALKLYKNGTFVYDQNTMSHGGYMGNYIIVDDKIILNNLFIMGNGAGITVSLGNKELSINSDGNIIDHKLKIGIFDFEDVILKKSTDSLDNEFNQIIDNYSISNKKGSFLPFFIVIFYIS